MSSYKYALASSIVIAVIFAGIAGYLLTKPPVIESRTVTREVPVERTVTREVTVTQRQATVTQTSTVTREVTVQPKPTTVEKIPFFDAPMTAEYRKIIDDAKKEGKVVFYTPRSAEDQAIVNKIFEEKYGIKVESVSMRAAELGARFTEESRLGRHFADVVLVGVDPLVPFKKLGLFSIYRGPAWQQSPQWAKDPEGYWVATEFLPLGATYNPKLIPASEHPKTWKDLLNPRFKGKIAMYDPRVGTFGIFTYTGLRDEKVLGQGFWRDLLQKQSPIRWETSGLAIGRLVQTGEVLVGLGIQVIAPTQFAIRAGISLDEIPIAPLQNYVVGFPQGASISKNAPRPNAAKLFVDYHASLEAQNALGATGNILPTLPEGLFGKGMKSGEFMSKYQLINADWLNVDFAAEQKLWDKLLEEAGIRR